MDRERARRAIGLIDLTALDDRCTSDAVVALCQTAATQQTAAVCIWPDFVKVAARELDHSTVRVATVVNFPSGDERAFAVGVVTERALVDGADEIDVVLPYRAFAAGDRAWCADVLDEVRHRAEIATLKVILETGELDGPGSVERAAAFAIDHGADFVKTSTGKSPVSATREAAAAMLGVIAATDRRVGLKPSGGIRTAADADVYLDLAATVMGDEWITPATFRFGASGLLAALVGVAEDRDDTSAPESAY